MTSVTEPLSPNIPANSVNEENIPTTPPLSPLANKKSATSTDSTIAGTLETAESSEQAANGSVQMYSVSEITSDLTERLNFMLDQINKNDTELSRCLDNVEQRLDKLEKKTMS